MTFKDFRSAIEKQLNSHCYEIKYPKNHNENFFWITVKGTNIGNDVCHYEFVKDENSNAADEMYKINLEIHYEFDNADKYIPKLFNRILGKPIEPRFKNESSSQIGIVYKQFNSSDSNLIRDCINSLEEMDRKYQEKFIN